MIWSRWPPAHARRSASCTTATRSSCGFPTAAIRNGYTVKHPEQARTSRASFALASSGLDGRDARRRSATEDDGGPSSTVGPDQTPRGARRSSTLPPTRPLASRMPITFHRHRSVRPASGRAPRRVPRAGRRRHVPGTRAMTGAPRTGPQLASDHGLCCCLVAFFGVVLVVNGVMIVAGGVDLRRGRHRRALPARACATIATLEAAARAGRARLAGRTLQSAPRRRRRRGASSLPRRCGRPLTGARQSTRLRASGRPARDDEDRMPLGGDRAGRYVARASIPRAPASMGRLDRPSREGERHVRDLGAIAVVLTRRAEADGRAALDLTALPCRDVDDRQSRRHGDARGRGHALRRLHAHDRGALEAAPGRRRRRAPTSPTKRVARCDWRERALGSARR